MQATRVPVSVRAAVALAVAALTVSGVLAFASAVNAAPKPNPHSQSNVITLRPVG